MSIKCRILNVSQPYGHQRRVTGVALLFSSVPKIQGAMDFTHAHAHTFRIIYSEELQDLKWNPYLMFHLETVKVDHKCTNFNTKIDFGLLKLLEGGKPYKKKDYQKLHGIHVISLFG